MTRGAIYRGPAVPRTTPRRERKQFEALGLVVALTCILGTPGCRRVESEPISSFGGGSARKPPFLDILGFWKVHLGEALRLLAMVPESVPTSPVKELFAILDEILEDDVPLAFLFLDSDVHGASLGFAFPGRREPFLGQAARVPEMGYDAERDVFVLPVVREIANLGDMMRLASRLQSRVSPGSWHPYCLVEDQIDGRDVCLLIPARDGLRNVRETLREGGVFDPEVGVQYAVNADFDRLFEGVRRELELMLDTMTSLQPMAQDMPRRGRPYPFTPPVLRTGLDILAGIDHLFGQVDRDNAASLFIQTLQETRADELRVLLKPLPLEQMLSLATPASIVMNLDLDAVRDLLKPRHRRRPPPRSNLALGDFFSGEVVLGVELVSLSDFDLWPVLRLLWKTDGRGALELREAMRDRLPRFLEATLEGLVETPPEYTPGSEVLPGRYLDRLTVSIAGRPVELDLYFGPDGLDIAPPHAKGDLVRRHVARLPIHAFDFSPLPDSLAVLATLQLPFPLMMGVWTEAQGIAAHLHVVLE